MVRSANPAKSRSRSGAPRSGVGIGASSAVTGRPGVRARRSAERRGAILTAALAQFCERGFAATRLDDVAKRAGVAKGTIYLHFADKETLFEELIRLELSPVVAALERASNADIPIRMVADQLTELFVREIHGSHRKDVIRLIIAEGPRFPALAEFYYREVIARVMEAVRGLMRRAVERGELKDDALVRFPQILAAPGVVSVVWSGLFDRFAPLDVRALMKAHFDLIFGGGAS